jgi:uncharacterized protein YjiS (DUF1127 family)
MSHTVVDADRIEPWRHWHSTPITTLILWHHRLRTRQQLRRLDRRELEDVGIDPLARKREVAKWFWQP